jgi:hypothetical protein
MIGNTSHCGVLDSKSEGLGLLRNQAFIRVCTGSEKLNT